jgi:hypothetical protein
MQVPQPNPSDIKSAPSAAGTRSNSDSSTCQHTIIHALAISRHLHQKQLELLRYLNIRRDPLHREQSLPLSYTHLHHATGITIEHIRRNGLHRLFACGLVSVVHQGLGGTVYRLHYDEAIVTQILEQLLPTITCTSSFTSVVHSAEEELSLLQRRLSVLTQVEENRQAVRRAEFLAGLTPGQLAWIADSAKSAVDQQEGIRFVHDRFHHYEAQRLRLIDEWVARTGYGEVVPTLSTSPQPL